MDRFPARPPEPKGMLRNLINVSSNESEEERSQQTSVKLASVTDWKPLTTRETPSSGAGSRIALHQETAPSVNRNMGELPVELNVLGTAGPGDHLPKLESRPDLTKPSAEIEFQKCEEHTSLQKPTSFQHPKYLIGEEYVTPTSVYRSGTPGGTSPFLGSRNALACKGHNKPSEQENSLTNVSTKRAASPPVKRSNRLKRQNSSPTLKSKRRSNIFTSTEGGFLSNLVANRPSAARGLVGVASAALAAARAGTFMSTYEEPETAWGKSRSLDKRSSETCRQPTEHICSYCQHLTVCPHHCVPQPSVITNWDIPNTKFFWKRRYSDSLLESPDGRISEPSVQVFVCANCDQHGVLTQPNLGVFRDYNWMHSPKSNPMFYRKVSLNDLSPMHIEPTDRQFLHSSWMALSSDHLSEMVVGPPSRSTSTAILDGALDGATQNLIGVQAVTKHRSNQQSVGQLGQDQLRKTSRDAKSSSYIRPKRQGLDSIGLDFMRLNGARPGLIQLRHVKEFKAAKELELQQQKKAQSEKARQKAAVVLGNAGPFALLGHTVGAMQPNQQNPFHHLISGGVLGARVLAMAGKDKPASKLETGSTDKGITTSINTTVDSDMPKQPLKEDLSTQLNLRATGSRSSSRASMINTTCSLMSQGAPVYLQREPTLGPLPARLSKLRRKLIRSVTSAAGGTKSASAGSIIHGSVSELHGNLSAPGLTRHATEEYDECERGELAQFQAPGDWLDKGAHSESAVSTQDQSVTTVLDEPRGRRTPSQDGDILVQPTISTNDTTSGTTLEESASVRSRRYFTSSFTEQEPIVSTVHTQHKMMTNRAVSTASSTCARKRRDNFRKGRSSAFTWVVNDTIGETGEYPQEEETPLLSTIVPSESRSVELQENTLKQIPPNVTSKSVEFVCTDRENRFIENRSFRPALSHVYVNEQCTKEVKDILKPPDIPVLKVDDISRDQDSSEEGTSFQRRRDAVNNQLHQRTIRNVGYRLGRRKRLFEKRCRISDFALIFALFGIVVMLVETELTFIGVYQKDSIYSYFTKSLISLSTAVLLGLVLAYHVYVIKIFSSDDSIEDWRMAIDQNRILQMTAELLVCIIHPFPGSSYIHLNIPQSYIGPESEYYSFGHCEQLSHRYFISKYVNFTVPLTRSNGTQRDHFALSPANSSSTHDTHHNRLISIDLVLSVPMFFRLYLVFRTMLLHSKLFTDAGSRSIGAMNKVSFDMRFIFKTLMTMCPGKLLLGFILCLWIVYSWSLRACESFSSQDRVSLLNSMWLVAVTFLSIGYGDIVPHTYCGRAIALATGVMGSGCTALIVAVFARKLELSKAEKHVIHFMVENQLNKKVKNYAANVLRETWLIYKYTKLVNRVDAAKVRTHQRKFLRAIHGLRRMKMDQRKVQDSANTLVDLAKTQSNIYETVTDVRMEQNCLSHRMELMETTLIKLQEQMRTLPGILRATVMQQQFAYQKFASGRSNEQPSPGGHQTTIEQK